MNITSNWLKEHLDTQFTENQIINKLTDIGLEVESVETQSSESDSFLIAKIRQMTDCDIIIPSTDIVNHKEAIIFAFLSVLKMRGEVNCFASVTGSKHDHSSGKIFFPNSIID